MGVMRKSIPIILVLFCASIHLIFPQADLLNARVRGLTIKNSDEFVTISFKITGAFTEEIIERIHSGIEISFKHAIKIFKKNPVFFYRRTIVERVILTTVEYNTLTKQYTLKKQIDESDVETMLTDDLDEVEKWMTEIDHFKVEEVSRIKGKKNYFLKIRTSLAPNFLLFFIPYDYSASKERELAF
jgi:hypothetical protein